MRNDLDPKDFAWVPVAYGVCALVMGFGGLIAMFENPVPVAGQIKIGITVMGVALAAGLVMFATFLIQITVGPAPPSKD